MVYPMMTRTKLMHFRVFMGLVFTTALLTLVAGFVYNNFERYRASTGWVTHTYIVIGELDNILSMLKDVQAAQRGYIITNQETYLSPYDIALPKIDASFNRLRGLLQDNPDQSGRLTVLQNKVTERTQHATAIIETFKAQGRDAAFAMVLSGTGKREMDDARDLVRVMEDEELKLLTLRKEQANEAATRTLYLGGIGTVIAFFTVMLIFWLIDRESRHRARTGEALQASLEKSETLVSQAQLSSRLSDYLQSCGNTAEAYDIIAKHMPLFMPGARGFIGSYNNSRNIICIRGTWGDGACGTDDFLPEDCWALRRGGAHYTSDAGCEPRCKHICAAPSATLCLPMQAHGETHGLIYFEADSTTDLPEAKVHWLASIAEQASMALANLRLQEKLQLQSVSDPLTTLFNRRYMEATLERELARAARQQAPMALMILDIDHFKKFNDTWGHDAGDAVLIAFANMLKQNTRTEDVVCRLGGEEFVILLPGASLDAARQRAEIICAATRSLKVSHNGQSLGQITASVGVSVYPESGTSPEYLLSNADTALYEAKDNGRDRVVLAKNQN